MGTNSFSGAEALLRHSRKLLLGEAEAADVFLQNADIRNDKKARAARLFEGLRMDHTFLHPHAARPNSNGRIHYAGHIFGAPKDVNDVDPLGNIFEPRVGFLAEYFSLFGIHGDDSITRRLKIARHSVARAMRLAGKTD